MGEEGCLLARQWVQFVQWWTRMFVDVKYWVLQLEVQENNYQFVNKKIKEKIPGQVLEQ